MSINNKQSRQVHCRHSVFCMTYILHVTTQEKVPQRKSTRKRITIKNSSYSMSRQDEQKAAL